MRIDKPTGVQSELTGSFTGSFIGEFTGKFSSTIGTAVSGAFTQDSSSFASRIDDLETFEANIDNTYATDGDVTAVSNRVGTLEGKTLLSSSAQIAPDISGSFTQLSSSVASAYLLNTTDTLTGDLTVTGTITAQEFHTEFVSASIIYQSGSTQFGNSSDDTHIFTGNVGIGTDSPSAKLEVVGEAWVGNGTDGIKLSYSAGNSTGIVDTEYTSTGLEFRVGGDEKMRIDVNGVSYFTRSSQTLLLNPNYGGSNTHAQIQATGNMALAFATGGDNERMRIDSSGSVGIGVAPTHKLTLRNDVAATTDLDPTSIKLYNNNDGGAAIEFSNGVSGNSKLSFGVEGTGASTDETYIGFNTSQNGATATERMRIQSDGSVSFNQGSTSIPVGGISHYTNNYLYIKGGTAGAAMGNDDFGSAFYALDNGDINIVAGSSNALVVKASGNVGIGTTDPQAVLHLHGDTTSWTTSPTIVMSSSSTANANIRNWRIGPADTNYGNFHIGVSDTQGGIVDSNAEASTFTIDYTGNVGIGTTSPSAKLHIWTPNNSGAIGLYLGNTSNPDHGNVLAIARRGTDFTLNDSSLVVYSKQNSFGTYEAAHFRARGYKFQKHDGTEFLAINQNGNVGIGTTSADKKLEVKISDNTDGVYFAQTIGGSRASAGYSVGIGIDPEGYGYRNKVGIVVQGHPSGWSAGKMHFLNRLDIGTNAEADLSHSRMTIDYTGLVGIGSQTPQAALDVGGSAVTRVRINSNGGTNAGVLLAENGTDYWSFASTSGGNLQFFREGGGGNKMMLTTDGNLGINTSSPSYKLDVEGAVAFTDEIMARSGTTSITNSDHVWQGKFTGNGSFIHLKTNLGWGGNTQMYSFHFLGYAYGEANPVNAQIGFYNYPPSSAPINVGSSGSHTIVLYQSSDGYIVIRIQFTNSYFTGLTMSARNTAQGVTWPSITSTAQNGTSNHF